MATISRSMTEEEFLALPDVEGVQRALIRGGLVEWPLTTRAFAHSLVIVNISFCLKAWLNTQLSPRGCIVGGEARVRLRLDPLTVVGVDIAYIPPEAKPEHPRTAGRVEGPPVLVVEVLSPSNRVEDIMDKIDEYLGTGVSLVWLVEPRYSTVTVYRADAKPQLFNVDQEITAEPFLPGFRVAVAKFFEDLDN